MKFLGLEVIDLTKVAVFIAAAVGAFIGLSEVTDPRMSATALIGVSGTLTGFCITALSILVSNSDKQFMRQIRMTGHFQRLVKDISIIALLWIGVILLCGASHFTHNTTQDVLLALGVGLFAFTMIGLVSAGSKFITVLSILTRAE